MRSRAPRLGELLEQRGWITREQLLRALRNQKVVGGKLGTCLLEIDALTEDSLCRGLSEQQGVPSVAPEELRSIAYEVIQLLPAKVARRLLCVPFRASGTQVHVAVLDARDLAVMDELAFVTGRRVHMHVASEVRLCEALEKHYHEESPPRLSKLLERLNRSRFLWRDQAVVEEPTETREALQWDPGLGDRPRRPSGPREPSFLPSFANGRAPELPVLEPTAPPAPTAPTSPQDPTDAPGAAPASHRGEPAAPSTPAAPAAAARVVAPPPEPAPSEAEGSDETQELTGELLIEPLTLDEGERRLLAPEDRDAVGRVLVDFAAARAARVLLFKVHRNEISGWMAAGESLDGPRFEKFKARLDRPSVFLTLASGAALSRGPLADLPVHAELAAVLPGPPADDTLLLPVRVRGRLVTVLYAEPRSTSFEPRIVADLQRLIAKAEIAFELCIMRAKLKRA